jgi:hypothetical protein
MSYPFAHNRLAFFEPIMVEAGTTTKPLCAVDIGAANGTHGEFVCVQPCVIREAKFTVTLENVVGTTTAPYVVLTKYPTPGAAGTAVAIGTITVPTAATIGKSYYKSDLAIACAVGDVVQVKWVIGTGGTVAGIGNVDWKCEASSEVVGNNSDMVASST